MSKIPFLDLQSINARYREELVEAATRVINSGWYLLGKEVEALEADFAGWCGAKHAVGVSNGLAALKLVLQAWIIQGKLKEGDAVLVPANTFIASLLAISAAGLKPVLVEPDEATFNLSLAGVQAAHTPEVKAVMAVHLYGRMAPMHELAPYCEQNNLLLIEDAAQAHGAAISGRFAGSWGDAAGFSFYPGKNMGALGDGGMVTCKDAELANLVRALANYGSHKKYEHIYQGSNERLDEIQAAMLRVKLGYMDEDNALRRAVAQQYREGINNPHIILPDSPQDEREHVWHLFVIRTGERENFMKRMEENGVECLIHYPIPLHEQKAYQSDYSSSDFPFSQRLHSEVVSLPMSPVIHDAQVQKVVDAVNLYTILT